ncbi:MAG TPA: hypothetical protein VN752_03780 [Solirubrobacterales bacterium]|nr:hypothetical protein [Solirubrobacterales bacterium]
MGSLYGFEVESDLQLRRLNSAPGGRGKLKVEAAELPAADGEPVSTLTDDAGRCWYASYELDCNACLLQLPPTGSFLLEPEAGRIGVEAGSGDEELLEHRIASSAICTLLAMRGDLALHAAAVEVEGRAVVFCGPTQRGKSTLARVLGEMGYGLLSEDGIAIELDPRGPIAHPGARGVRVRRADGNGRQRSELLADPGPGEPAAGRVVTLVLLGERGASLEVKPLEPYRALALLTPNLIHTGSRAGIAAAFAGLARLLNDVPAFTASLPDDLDALPEASLDLLDKAARRD